MIRKREMTKRLNLLHGSPDFLFREVGDDGRAAVHKAAEIPMCEEIVWVAGRTVLPDGTEIPSVFRMQPLSGDIPVSVYWRIGSSWYQSDDADALEALSRARDGVFPFTWRYGLPYSPPERTKPTLP